MNDMVLGRPKPAAVSTAIDALRAFLADRLVTTRAVREQHGHTTTWIACAPPDAVAFPRSTEEIQQIVRVCAKHDLPIIPYGVGSSFEGGVNAPLGGVSLDMREMNRVLAVHPEDFDCVVEPGITRMQLNNHLRASGLFFSVDPGADASIGGMASTRASGTTAVRYGTMKDNVLALKAVVASGDVMSTSRRARKSSAGYDLTRLMVGAEGTLGIIAELTLKLHGVPEAVAAAVCRFPSIAAACDAAITAIQLGIPVARVELLDEVQVRACNADAKLGLDEAPMLFLEFHGTEASVVEQSQRFGEVAEEQGGAAFEWALRTEERNRLWAARHHVFWANKSFRPGASAIVTDVCVPISRLAECIVDTKRDIAESRLVAPLVAHAGDGNFHTVVMVMLEDADEVKRATGFIERLAERAIAMDGTCTGEHGIGEGKRRFLEPELGAVAVDAMRAIKRALDPRGIMNPGKVFLRATG